MYTKVKNKLRELAQELNNDVKGLSSSQQSNEKYEQFSKLQCKLSEFERVFEDFKRLKKKLQNMAEIEKQIGVVDYQISTDYAQVRQVYENLSGCQEELDELLMNICPENGGPDSEDILNYSYNIRKSCEAHRIYRNNFEVLPKYEFIYPKAQLKSYAWLYQYGQYNSKEPKCKKPEIIILTKDNKYQQSKDEIIGFGVLQFSIKNIQPPTQYRYTIDGTVPTPYAGELFQPDVRISIKKSCTLKIIGFRTGSIESDIYEKQIVIKQENNINDIHDQMADAVRPQHSIKSLDPMFFEGNYSPWSAGGLIHPPFTPGHTPGYTGLTPNYTPNYTPHLTSTYSKEHYPNEHSNFNTHKQIFKVLFVF